MRVAVVLMSDHTDVIYGVAIVEKKFVSCYCVREAAVKLIEDVFNRYGADESFKIHNPGVSLVAGHTIDVTLGNKAPYDTTFRYKLVTDEAGVININE